MDAGNQKVRARRFLRFSLRTLLVVTTLVAGVMGWLAAEFKAARDRNGHIVALRRHGAFFSLYNKRWAHLRPIAGVVRAGDCLRNAESRGGHVDVEA